MTISIRRKKTKKGISLYLDFNTRKNRYEFLKNLYLYDEEIMGRKLTRGEKEHNREIELKAEIIRSKRQREQIEGTLKLYGIEHKKKLESSFIAYFDKVMADRQDTSDSNRGNWRSARNHWVNFAGNRDIRFVDIDEKLLDDFRRYLLSSRDINGIKEGGLARNSALSYFTKLRVVVKQAVKDKYFQENPLDKVKSIQPEETKREILTTDEMRKLLDTPCDDPLLKRAFLFSCLTGMRHSDVTNLKWGNIQHSSDTGYFVRFRQQKTEGQVMIPISDEAYGFLGTKRGHEDKVFEGLYYSAWKNLKLKQWILDAGICRKLTYHSSRHSFATNQLNAGTDIVVVSNLLGHKDIKTTQIYAKVTDKTKIEAAQRISIKK